MIKGRNSNSEQKMIKSLSIFPIFFLAIQATGKFSILNYPSSLDFKGDDKLNANNLGDVLSASLGYFVDSESKWNGLYINDPFSVPRSAVVLLIDGINEIHVNDKVKNYQLVGNTAEDSLNFVASTVEASNAIVADIDLSQGQEGLHTYADIFGEIPISKDTKSSNSLKPDLHSEDKLFLEEISTLNALTESLSQLSRRPNLLIIRMSLSSLATAHGEKSPALSEAVKILSEAVRKLSDESKKAYKDDILVVVATTQGQVYSRSKRQADDNKSEDLNLATDYNEDYPVIFNIILWFGVVFAFALLAISYSIASMDPGRDSIIYRMTSTRMKKDN